MVVEDHFDGGVRRISGIEFLEQTDELPRAMAIFDASANLAGEQVDPGEQAQRAMTLVFMIARPARMRPRLRRQVGGGAADRLDSGLLVVGDDRDVRLGTFGLAQDRDLAIDAQDLRHLLLESLVAAFEIIADLVRPHIVLVEDLADGALSEARQTGMSCRRGVLSDVTRQQPCCPKLVRISNLLGLLAGQRHHPCAGIVGNRRLPARPRTVVECGHHAKPHRTIKASLHGLMGQDTTLKALLSDYQMKFAFSLLQLTMTQEVKVPTPPYHSLFHLAICGA